MEKTTKKRRKFFLLTLLKEIGRLRKRYPSGETDYIDAGFITVLGIFNFVNQIIYNKNLIERSGYTLGLFFAAFLIWIIPFRKTIKAYIFMILAIAIHYDAPNPSDFSSIIFFLLAFSERKNISFGILVSICTAGVIAYKSAIVGDSAPQAIGMIVLIGYLYIRFFFTFFRHSVRPVHMKIKELTDQQQKVMNMHGPGGLSQKQIAAELGMSKDQVYDIILSVRKKLGSEDKPMPLSTVLATLWAYPKNRGEK